MGSNEFLTFEMAQERTEQSISNLHKGILMVLLVRKANEHMLVKVTPVLQ